MSSSSSRSYYSNKQSQFQSEQSEQKQKGQLSRPSSQTTQTFYTPHNQSFDSDMKQYEIPVVQNQEPLEFTLNNLNESLTAIHNQILSSYKYNSKLQQSLQELQFKQVQPSRIQNNDGQNLKQTPIPTVQHEDGLDIFLSNYTESTMLKIVLSCQQINDLNYEVDKGKLALIPIEVLLDIRESRRQLQSLALQQRRLIERLEKIMQSNDEKMDVRKYLSKSEAVVGTEKHQSDECLLF